MGSWNGATLMGVRGNLNFCEEDWLGERRKEESKGGEAKDLL